MKTFFILVVLFGLAACGKTNNSGSNPERTINPITTNDKYFDLVNKYRRSIGLKALIYSATIEDEALDHTTDMANGARFGHDGWKERCQRLRALLGSNSCGEIVAMGQQTPEAVLRAWLNSPSHRESIENPRVDTYWDWVCGECEWKSVLDADVS